MILTDSAFAFQCAGPLASQRATASRQVCARAPMMVSDYGVSRRSAVGAFALGALSFGPSMANADGEKPLVPGTFQSFLRQLYAKVTELTWNDFLPAHAEGELIKPPANSCAQGVGGKCEELAEGNPLILELQKKSAQNRLKYQKEELESYWNRNYKEFFDTTCSQKDTKVTNRFNESIHTARKQQLLQSFLP